ncbi:hypothetical protein O5154_28610, partial [Escherichia coli]|nr:hypothetical protein [Escherichia coli]
ARKPQSKDKVSSDTERISLRPSSSLLAFGGQKDSPSNTGNLHVSVEDKAILPIRVTTVH